MKLRHEAFLTSDIPEIRLGRIFLGDIRETPVLVGVSESLGVVSQRFVEATIGRHRPHLFRAEGRDDAPLANKEIEWVKWAINNEAAVHDAVIESVFDQYPSMREEVLDFFSKAEAKKLLPEIHSPEELKKLVGLTTIFVHPIAKRGKPFIGVELGCTWEIEHGVGILLHGAKVLEIGGADKAMTLWIAEKYAKKS